MANSQHRHFSYRWQGLAKGNTPTQGVIKAPDIHWAKVELQRQGIAVKQLRRLSSYPSFRARITTKDINLFTRQLASLLEVDISLSQGLSLLASSQNNESLKQLILRLKTQINAGLSLANSLREYPAYFDSFYTTLVEVGEQSGTLSLVFQQLGDCRDRSLELKQKIRKALVYPLVVMLVAIGVTLLLLLKVIPTFAATFSRFDAELPAMTSLVIKLSTLLQTHFTTMVWIVGVVVIITLLWRRYLPSSKKCIDRFLLSLPYIGKLQRMMMVACFSRTLATTFAAGVSLDEALNSISKILDNGVFSQAIVSIREQIIAGKKLQQAMASSGEFPPLALQLVALGEETGTLAKNLTRLASQYETEVSDQIDQLLTLLEPALMVVLGLVVGCLIVAIYLPMFQLGNVL